MKKCVILALFALVFGVCSCVFGKEAKGKADAAKTDWLVERFGMDLVNAKGKAVPLNSLKGKTIGVYFSAHWCPPCRAFTPKLVEFRNKNKEAFEVVFVSCDRDQESMRQYMDETGMKWPAVPFKGEKYRALSQEFKVSGIPCLIILNEKGEVVTMNGRGDVTQDPKNAIKTWKKAAQAK